MYFWRVDRLRDELRRGDLPPRALLGYVMLVAVETSVGFLPLRGGGGPSRFPLSWLVVSHFLVVAIIAGGVWRAYHGNGGPSGRSFLERFIPLYWVSVVRSTVLIRLPLLFVAPYVAGYMGRLTLSQFVALSLPRWLYWFTVYHRVGVEMRRVAETPVPEDTVSA